MVIWKNIGPRNYTEIIIDKNVSLKILLIKIYLEYLNLIKIMYQEFLTLLKNRSMFYPI